MSPQTVIALRREKLADLQSPCVETRRQAARDEYARLNMAGRLAMPEPCTHKPETFCEFPLADQTRLVIDDRVCPMFENFDEFDRLSAKHYPPLAWLVGVPISGRLTADEYADAIERLADECSDKLKASILRDTLARAVVDITPMVDDEGGVFIWATEIPMTAVAVMN